MNRMFLGWSEQRLLDALDAAQNDLSCGNTIVSTGSGDTNASSQMSYSPELRISQLQRALYEFDPVKYGIFCTAQQSRTRPVFNAGSTMF